MTDLTPPQVAYCSTANLEADTTTHPQERGTEESQKPA